MPIPLPLPTLGSAYNQDVQLVSPTISYASNFVDFKGKQTSTTTSAATYDSASVTLFAAMTVQPTAFHKGIIDTLIRRLKSDLSLTMGSSNWDELEGLIVLAQDSVQGEQAALLNWKTPGTYNGTLSSPNAPVWTAKKGYAGDVSANNRHIKTGFIPSAATKYAAQNCCLFFYNQNIWTTNSPFQEGIGSYDATNGDQLFMTYTAPDFLVGALHSGTFPTKNTRNDGFISTINKGDQGAIYRNGAKQNHVTIATNSLRSTRELYVLARNNAGTADLFGINLQCSVYGFGSAKLDQIRLNEAIQDYMKQIGTAITV